MVCGGASRCEGLRRSVPLAVQIRDKWVAGVKCTLLHSSKVDHITNST